MLSSLVIFTRITWVTGTTTIATFGDTMCMDSLGVQDGIDDGSCGIFAGVYSVNNTFVDPNCAGLYSPFNCLHTKVLTDIHSYCLLGCRLQLQCDTSPSWTVSLKCCTACIWEFFDPVIQCRLSIPQYIFSASDGSRFHTEHCLHTQRISS